MIRTFTQSLAILGCMAVTVLAQTQQVQVSAAQLTHDSVKTVSQGEQVLVTNFELPDGFVNLELDRVEVLAENARLEVGSVNGIEEFARPDVVILSGIVAGEPDTMAYLAISPYGTNGFVDLHGELISISTGPYAQDKNLQDSLMAARMADAINPANGPELCGYTPGDAKFEPFGPAKEYLPNPDRGTGACRIASIAIETDFEYTSRIFGGNTDASAAYAVSLIGAISEIYQRDMNVGLSIPFLRVWADDTDPYSSAGDPLDLVRSHWNSNMTHIERTLVHYLTGRTDTSYGGVAYLSVLCNGSFGYGVSAYLNGSFPYPLADHHGGNWDVVVVSHELGHNFGTGHTHNYSPPIDGCGNGDCSMAFGATIMSYCHTCSGGLSNLVLEFHPRVQDVIVGYMDSIGCDLTGDSMNAIADSVQTIQDVAIEIDVLANDEAQSCDAITIQSFDNTTSNGGAIELLAGQGPSGRDILRYTPAAGYGGLDSFSYTIVGISGTLSTSVEVNVRGFRAADTRINPIPGLGVKYYELNAPSSLPDFDLLSAYAEDVTMAVSYPSTSGNFMGSGRAEEVGTVIEGYVWAFVDGIYTFTTESDDGSRLFIGDELVVNNDGLHGMVRRAGDIPLYAGWHKIKIEFFENGGGAGLISTIEGPGVPQQALQGIMISHEANAQCSAADLNADGVINFFDVSIFLQLFNDQDSLADFSPDGVFNFFDVSIFLGIFSEGCP